MTFTPDHFNVWMEIPVSDLDKAVSFYNDVFKTELRRVTDMGPNEIAIFPAKERITGVELPGEYFGAYADGLVVEHGPVNDRLGDQPLLIVANPDAGGNVVVFNRSLADQTLTFELVDGELSDRETGSRWSYEGLAIDGPLTGSQLDAIDTVKVFWFAWFAFHPDTAVWTP